MFPHKSLRVNVAFGLRMRRKGRTERAAMADAMLARSILFQWLSGHTPFGPVLLPDGTLCPRPAAISATGSLHIGFCRVLDVAFFGTHVRAHVTPLAAPDLRLVEHLPQSEAPEPGAVFDLGAETYVVLNR